MAAIRPSARCFRYSSLTAVIILLSFSIYVIHENSSNKNTFVRQIAPRPRTPLLDRFTATDFRQNQTRSDDDVFYGNCSTDVIFSRPSEDLAEPLRWQPASTGSIPHDAYVFSAFFDVRWEPAGVVLIIGLATDYETGGARSRYCRMWFRDVDEPRQTSASFRFVPETHGRKYAVAFYTCPVQPEWSELPPYAVSLVDDPCQPSVSNVLLVNHGDPFSPAAVNYTVCLSVLHSDYDNRQQLVETFEADRMFGAERFVVYDFAIGSDARRVLASYERDGVVDVVPWNTLPVPTTPDWPRPTGTVVDATPEVHYFAQVAALNDCLYRNMFRSKFVLFSDVDEVVVPRVNNSWLAMLETATGNWMRTRPSTVFPGVYQIKSVFFRPQSAAQITPFWSKGHQLKLTALTTLEREKYVYPFDIRSKYFVWTKAAVMIGIHFPYELIDSNVKTVRVNKGIGLLHHYRQRAETDDEVEQTVSDRRMLHFKDKLLSLVEERLRAV